MHMEKIDIPGTNLQIIAESKDQADSIIKTISGRTSIAQAYCKSKCWPTELEQLTFEQILEIRALPEWKAAG